MHAMLTPIAQLAGEISACEPSREPMIRCARLLLACSLDQPTHELSRPFLDLAFCPGRAPHPMIDERLRRIAKFMAEDLPARHPCASNTLEAERILLRSFASFGDYPLAVVHRAIDAIELGEVTTSIHHGTHSADPLELTTALGVIRLDRVANFKDAEGASITNYRIGFSPASARKPGPLLEGTRYQDLESAKEALKALVSACG